MWVTVAGFSTTSRQSVDLHYL